ncbi:MAG: helicase-associated domain-containing protein [Planctomycetota bacterium]
MVQPDFSMIVIGNLPAVADFAPFTDPSPGNHDPHSRVLKVTRERVRSAAENGLTGHQMIERLEKHATVPIPKNVLQEIRNWAGSVRKVEVAPMLIFTCSDSSVADRLPGLLGQPGNRFSPTVVGFPPMTISPKIKTQLKKLGIHLTGETDYFSTGSQRSGNRHQEW